MNVTIENGIAGGVIEDTSLLSDNDTVNYGSNTRILLGYSGVRVGLIKVDLSSYSAIITGVESAYFGFNVTEFSDSDTVDSYEVIRPWEEYQATWRLAQTIDGWGTWGCKNTTTDRKAVADNSVLITSLGSDQKVVVSNSLAYQWATGINEGLFMELVGAEVISLSSAQHATEPAYFYMEYTIPDTYLVKGSWTLGRFIHTK